MAKETAIPAGPSLEEHFVSAKRPSDNKNIHESNPIASSCQKWRSRTQGLCHVIPLTIRVKPVNRPPQYRNANKTVCKEG